MSIDAEIARLVGKDLTFLVPGLQGAAVSRDIFVSREVLDLVGDDATPPPDLELIAGRARAKMDGITTGKAFVIGMNPKPGKKSPTCLVARNDPTHKGIVDIRLSDPNPGLRIFGAMAKKDVLIALTYAPRKGCKFSAEINRCRLVWDTLFPNHPPFYSNNYTEYFSNVLPG
jgi:hypothetical protein